MNNHDTAGSGMVCHGAPKIKTVTVPVLPVLETPWVFLYPCGTLVGTVVILNNKVLPVAVTTN
jgi:hypothetical protein